MNVALLSETCASFKAMTKNSDTKARKAGLRISVEKIKVMLIGSHPPKTLIITGQQLIECVQHFTYLGSTLSQDGSIDANVKYRTGKASAVFQ